MIHQSIPAGVPVYSVAYGGPFLGRYGQIYAEEGPTLGELVAAVPDLPAGFWGRGEVRISGHLIPRERWHVVRPRPSRSGLPVYVTLHLAPRGGAGGEGGSGNKQIVGIVAALALTVATMGIASGALAGLGGAFAGAGMFAAGSIGAKVLALGVGLAGSLALAALTKPPTKAEAAKESDPPSNASASGNLADPGGALPRVIGTHRVYPPYVNDARYYLQDGEEYVEVVCALAGPHKLEDIRIGDAAITDAEDITYETREGWGTDTALSFPAVQSRITGNSVQLSFYAYAPDVPGRLMHQANPALDLPKWHTFTTRHGWGRFRLRLEAPQGIGSNDSDTEDTYLMTPVRVRIKRRGSSTWINLPEAFLSSRKSKPVRAEIILNRTGIEPTPVAPNSYRGWVWAFRTVPTQTVAPIGSGGWTAHPYFGTSGTAYLNTTNVATSGVLHTQLGLDAVTYYLDPNLFPDGVYDVQIKRGMLFGTQALGTNYSIILSGSVFDFFGYYTNGGYHTTFYDDSVFGDLYVLRGQSEWDAPPVAAPGDALIAIRARNRAVESISVLASGYVQQIGTGTWITTSNPAEHYRDVLSGGLNAYPLPDDLRDDAALEDWRDHCAAEGYNCDMIVQGESVQDTLANIAACGYARPMQSETWGIYVDRDSSAEPPIQVFSARNSSGFRWEKAFPRLPDGFRVTYREREADYVENQIVVLRDGATGSNLENVTYSGIVEDGRARARAAFDLAQAVARGTFYYLTAPAEAIVCRRGDLVGVVHDVMEHRQGAARIVAKTVSAGLITHLLLDSAVTVETGVPMGIVIRRADGTFSTHAISNGTGEHTLVALTTPASDATVSILSGHGSETVDAVEPGALVYFGPVATQMTRMLVFAIAPGEDFTFALTLVDEAPDLSRAALPSYDAPGSVSLTVAGTWDFVVPRYETALTVTLDGGSSGSYGVTNTTTFPAPTAGGNTTFAGLTAGGSPIPASRTTAGAGGSASGGDTNTTGNAGAAPTGTTASGAGGNAVGTTGTGGAARTTAGAGNAGTANGAGAGGAFATILGTNYLTSGSGSGGRVVKTYAPGDLAPGTVLSVVVGAAGAAGAGTTQAGAAGKAGKAEISWS